MSLHTKNGVPLVVEGHRVYNPDGENFGQVHRDRVMTSGVVIGEQSLAIG
jgi:hypothetical protein